MRKKYTMITIKQTVLGASFVFVLALIVLLFPYIDEAPAFGACPDYDWVCDFYDPGSVLTAVCAFEDNFEMCYGEEMRALAPNDSDDFPKTWFIWAEGTITPSGYYPCNLIQFGKKKTLLEIPENPYSICKATLETSNHKYHIHFVSNPDSDCLGWVQCMEY